MSNLKFSLKDVVSYNYNGREMIGTVVECMSDGTYQMEWKDPNVFVKEKYIKEDDLTLYKTTYTKPRRTDKKGIKQQQEKELKTMTTIENQEIETVESVTPVEEKKPAKKSKLKVAKEKVEKETPSSVKEEENPFLLIRLSHDEGTVLDIPLSGLIPLDTTPIKKARYAMRQTSDKHVEEMVLALEDGEIFPPILVQASSMGFIVIDGYHRWASYIKWFTGKMMNEADIKSTLENTMVKAVCLNATQERQVINAAFKANLSNGLPASENSRARYAVWLIEDAKENNEKMSMRQAGLLARVSHQAISALLKRESMKQNKMLDDIVSYKEDAEEVETLAAEKEDKKDEDDLKKATASLFSSIKKIYGLLDNKDLLIKYFTEFNKEKELDASAVVAIAESLLAME